MKKIFIALMIFGAGASTAQTRHEIPVLPYDRGALAPVMSEETVDYHYGKHVQAYVDKLNQLVPGTEYENATVENIVMFAEGAIFDNGAQIYNHKLFFDMFAPEASAKHTPTGKLAEAITRDFGSLDEFKKKLKESATGLFGSGWTWLAADKDGKLHIISKQNAGNPLRDGYTPLMGIDVWEHSYYIDYRNNRGGYIDNLWRIIDWTIIENRYQH